MDDSVKHILKIADTPQGDAAPADVPGADPQPARATAKGKRRKRRSLVQRLTPDEMDDEIRRVNLGKGGLMIARGTEPESAD